MTTFDWMLLSDTIPELFYHQHAIKFYSVSMKDLARARAKSQNQENQDKTVDNFGYYAHYILYQAQLSEL